MSRDPFTVDEVKDYMKTTEEYQDRIEKFFVTTEEVADAGDDEDKEISDEGSECQQRPSSVTAQLETAGEIDMESMQNNDSSKDDWAMSDAPDEIIEVSSSEGDQLQNIQKSANVVNGSTMNLTHAVPVQNFQRSIITFARSPSPPRTTFKAPNTANRRHRARGRGRGLGARGRGSRRDLHSRLGHGDYYDPFS